MFPPNATSQDIFLTRLFEEPLVPIGADPTLQGVAGVMEQETVPPERRHWAFSRTDMLQVQPSWHLLPFRLHGQNLETSIHQRRSTYHYI
jgi:hypothetical protein